jgi:hypothetical protein
MGETVVLRSRAAQVLGVAMVVVAAVGGWADLARVGAPVALFGLLGWAAFWRPHVEVSDGGVRVVNTLRTVQVPWPAVESVDGRYGLRLVTAYGRLSAWGAPAPVGRQRARGEQSATAVVVQQRLDALREAGHLQDPRLERPALGTTWNLPLVAVAAVLLVASVVLPLLA